MVDNQQASKAHTLLTQRSALFYTLGDLAPTTQEVWVVFHGYGQLASFFIRHFRGLESPTRAIVAPEGLSRFYLGVNEWDRVGASWMTKYERELEIDDQLAYLDAVWAAVMQAVPACKRVCVLGFSQGVSAAWRWLNQSANSPVPQQFVLWAGMPPNESGRLVTHSEMKLDVVYGTNDPFITPERVAAIQEMLAPFGQRVHTHSFEGEHTLHAPTLRALLT
jgi:predicted esterase